MTKTPQAAMLNMGALENLRAPDQLRIELGIPAHMMVLLIDALKADGYELREDVSRQLNLASLIPFSNVDKDAIRVRRLAKRIDEAATTLLELVTADTHTEKLLIVASWVLTLVDENLFPDPRNVTVTASLLMIEDAKAVTVDSAWALQDARVKSFVGTLMSRARLLGYYHQKELQMDHGLRTGND